MYTKFGMKLEEFCIEIIDSKASSFKRDKRKTLCVRINFLMSFNDFFLQVEWVRVPLGGGGDGDSNSELKERKINQKQTKEKMWKTS